MAEATRIIILWREPERILEWGNYVAQDRKEAERAVENIKKSGAHQIHAYELGNAIPELSSQY